MSDIEYNDPVYTSIDAVPIDSKENGRCSRCGSMVLDYALHTLHHRELDELVQVVKAWIETMNPLPQPTSFPELPEDIARALGGRLSGRALGG